MTVRFRWPRLARPFRLPRPAVLPLACALALAVALPVRAQEARLQLPAFDGLAARAAETVDVTLDASLLKLAAGFLGEGEGDVKALLADLQGIYVKSFTFEQDAQVPRADLDALRAQLGRGKWSRIVGVRNAKQGEDSEVYAWLDNNQYGGLAVITVEPRELTIVNIVGRIDLEKLRRLEGQFGVPKLGVDPPKE
jgi:hypothetical protein